MRWKPNVVVAAIIERDGQFLLVEEYIDNVLKLNQPAGHLEENESLTEAVIREVKEETASVFEPQSLIGVYRYVSDQNSDCYLRFCFYGVCLRELDCALDKDIVRTRWLSLESILEESQCLRSPMVIRCIRDYLNGQSYGLDMLA